MKRVFGIALAIACGAFDASMAEQCDVETHFTPIEKMTPIVIQQLQSAKQGVYLSLFGIHNQAIADTLVQLHKKGIKVYVNLDKRQSRHQFSSPLTTLISAGVPVLIKPTSALEHNKYAIVDPGTPAAFVLMGSWNFSENAEKQDNSVAIIRHCPAVVNAFKANFDYITRRDSQ